METRKCSGKQKHNNNNNKLMKKLMDHGWKFSA